MITEASITLEDTPLGPRYIAKVVAQGKEPLIVADVDFDEAMSKLQSLSDSSRREDRLIDAHYSNQR